MGGERKDAVYTCLQLDPELSFLSVVRQEEKFPVCDDKVTAVGVGVNTQTKAQICSFGNGFKGFICSFKSRG